MMDCVFAQIFFLADNDGGGDGWAQLLVFVVMAVIYGLAALAKSKSNKAIDFDEEEDEELEKSFAHSQQKLREQQGVERTADVKRSFSWEPFELEEMQRQQAFAERQEEELEVKTVKAMTKKEATIEDEETEVEIQDVLNFENSEDLQNAILHCEILGKPVSMRQGPTGL